jgi:hypothetical protein
MADRIALLLEATQAPYPPRTGGNPSHAPSLPATPGTDVSVRRAGRSNSLPTEYVTYLDAVYLPQGLALYRSLSALDSAFRLTVYAMDEIACDALNRLDLPHLEIRDPWSRLPSEFTALRNARDWVSLMWTSTPYVLMDRLLDLDVGQAAYYVDADLAFFKEPLPVIQEFDAGSRGILITAHNFSPEYDATPSVGEFAVQFLGARSGSAEPVLRSWALQCLASCSRTPQEAAFGDQKYLDDWPSEFPGVVHVASDQEWFQGPWNASRFPPSRAIAFHFHGLRLLGPQRVLLSTHYALPRPTIDYLYRPYLSFLEWSTQRMQALGLPIPQQARPLGAIKRARSLAGQLRRVWVGSQSVNYLPLATLSLQSSRAGDPDVE